MTHHIRQYHLHLTLNGPEADGLALQRQLAGLCSEHLLPALEQVLDRCVPPNGHLTLDRLEIEAGPLSLGRLKQDAAALVAQAVEKALRDQTARLRTAPQLVTDVQLKTTSQTIEAAFFHFLSTGRLPWAFRLPEGRRLEQAVLEAWAERTGPAAIPGRVREPLRRALASATGRQRLGWQFSVAFREKLLAVFWPGHLRILEEIRAALPGGGDAPGPLLSAGDIAGFEQLLWETVLADVASNAPATTAAAVVSKTWPRLPATAHPSQLAARLERQWPGSTQAPTATPAAKAADAAPKSKAKPRHPELANPTTNEPPATPASTAENPAEAEEGYYLDNAGLVLLHPFLPRFFEGLGLAENGRLRQPERALSLLHFLATGQPTAPEHALTLPKLLCAVPQPQPTIADVGLTIAETDEADALLRAVVQHWTALRSTSPDALRGTFLARPGKLSRRPNGGDWLLQVEPLSYDILLDQLPWGISMIQLPWMPQMLRVEWG